MEELTWAQSRQRLMAKLARLDPSLGLRATDAEARYASRCATFIAQTEEYEHTDRVSHGFHGEHEDAAEESIAEEVEAPAEPIPDYLL